MLMTCCVRAQDSSEPIICLRPSMPEFPGWYDSLMKFMENFHMPDSITFKGQVMVSFEVDTTGCVGFVKLKTSSGIELLDVAIIQYYLTMPRWKPGSEKDGVKYLSPLKFE